MQNLAIQVKNLTKKYDEHSVFEDLSFELLKEDSLAIVGASGCGKSTLLYILAGLLTYDAGTVDIGEKKTGRIAFILQDYGLFPWKTVQENVSLALTIQGQSSKQAKKTSLAMLAELGLEGLENRYPYSLSGGQAQRVAIARALVTHPDILLMDEAFSSLDNLNRELMQKILLELWKIKRFTIVFVTHSVTEALYLGKKIMVLSSNSKQDKLWLDNEYFGVELSKQSSGYLDICQQIYAKLAT